MRATPDRPSVLELERLERALCSEAAPRRQLTSALAGIERALRQHGRDIDRAGGLIDEEQQVARPSLARAAEQLRQHIQELAEEAQALRREAERDVDEDGLMLRSRLLYEALQRLRNAEADIAYEGVETDIGCGD